MSVEPQSSSTATRNEIPTVARQGAVALLLALVVNILVATVARWLDIGTEIEPLTYPPIVIFTTVGVIGASIVYLVLQRVTARPDRLFVSISVIVLILSVIPDFVIIPEQAGGSFAAGAVLAVLHVTTASIVVWRLVDWQGWPRTDEG